MPDGQSQIPVYLPDQTVIGRASVSVVGGFATIKLDVDSTTAELIQEALVGLSIVYLARDAVEEVQNKEKN